jgi:hypothetical protein
MSGPVELVDMAPKPKGNDAHSVRPGDQLERSVAWDKPSDFYFRPDQFEGFEDDEPKRIISA